MRYSHQREMILEAIKNVKTHPTANTVYEQLRKVDDKLSLGTVYRNLNVLTEHGDIHAVYTGDNKVHYDGDTAPHSHFVCKECKRIIDIFITPQIPDEVANSCDFEIEEEKTIYYGKCRKCSENS